MSDSLERYFAEALSWSIRSDWKFLIWLVDNRGMSVAAIENPYTKVLYDVASRVYARAAPQGKIPSVGDVIVEMQSKYGEDTATAWASKIYDMEAPSTVMPRDVADKMVSKYERGEIVEIVRSWVESSSNSDNIRRSVSDLVDKITTTLSDNELSSRPRQIMESVWESGVHLPQTTGYSRLDKGLDGGWTPTKLYLLGMPSSHGKSSSSCNFTSRRAEMGLPTILNSFEMDAFSLISRMICDMAEVDIRTAQDPNRNARSAEFDRIQSALDVIDAYVRIYEEPCGTQEIERRIRRHKVEFQGSAILSILDHVGIAKRSGTGSDWSELETLAYDLHSVGKRQQVAQLCLSQVPDGVERELVENNMVVYNKDYRGSRGLRNALDYGIMGCRHNGYDLIDGKKEPVAAYRYHTVYQITKNRTTGRTFWGVFRYVPQYYRLTNDRDQGTSEDRYH